jgi:hypothetical protein
MHIALSAQSNRNSNINDLREAAGRGRVKEELEKANIWLLDEAACNEQSGRWEPPAKENEKCGTDFVALTQQLPDTRAYKHCTDCTNSDCRPNAHFRAFFLPKVANPGKRKDRKTDDQVERWTGMSTMCCITNKPILYHLFGGWPTLSVSQVGITPDVGAPSFAFFLAKGGLPKAPLTNILFASRARRPHTLRYCPATAGACYN